jgi:hypothetical protein
MQVAYMGEEFPEKIGIREMMPIAISVLDEVGIRDREVVMGSKHPQVRFRVNGRRSMCSLFQVRHQITNRRQIRRATKSDIEQDERRHLALH